MISVGITIPPNNTTLTILGSEIPPNNTILITLGREIGWTFGHLDFYIGKKSKCPESKLLPPLSPSGWPGVAVER